MFDTPAIVEEMFFVQQVNLSTLRGLYDLLFFYSLKSKECNTDEENIPVLNIKTIVYQNMIIENSNMRRHVRREILFFK